MDLYACNDAGNPNEFLAYRILYYIYINNTSDALKLVAGLSQKEKQTEDVSFAIKVFSAWSEGNYCQFFKLYLIAPKMGGYLMDAYVQRERNLAMKKMLRAYKPWVSVDKVTSLLGYPDSETTQVYLDELNVIYTNATKNNVDCKKTVIEL